MDINLIGHDKGPAIAAGTVLMNLLDTLIEKRVIARDEASDIIKRSAAEIRASGPSTSAALDAVRVLAKMATRLSENNI
jgi:hypothetical protein